MSTIEINAVFNIKKMLIKRGYELIEEKEDDEDDEDEYFIVKASKNKDRMISFICKEEKLSIQGIKDFMSIMNKKNFNRCIIVYREIVTSSAKKSLEIMDYNIELFNIYELQLDITEHYLVPKHEKVTKDEKENLDKNFKGKLPIILLSDPISRYYFFQRGEYIRITRKDGTVLYRVVK